MDLITLLKYHEGLRLKPYRDTTGHLTIGFGRNLDTQGITPEEAAYLLQHDIEDVYDLMPKLWPWIKQLSDVRQAVLYEMAFNLGSVGLMRFKATLAHVQAGRYEQAAAAMLQSRWARQVKGRARRLAQMMRSDCWPDDVG